MYRGARYGAPEILTEPSFFASVEVFAKTYGLTAAFYLDLQNPKIVDIAGWHDYNFEGVSLGMDSGEREQSNQDLIDEGYDSVLANFGPIVVVYLLDPDLATLI